jgi:hypothetical protein
MNDSFVFNQLTELKRKTVETPENLGEIRFEAVGLFWFILMQQAKHQGGKIGGADLSQAGPKELWRIAASCPIVAEELAKADNAIEEAWREYPIFQREFRELLAQCCIRIAASCGYCFQRGGLDGVWWNAQRQDWMIAKLTVSACPS